MQKLSKSEILEIIQKTSHIALDVSAYSCSDIKEIAKQCKEQNCILTLQNANHFSKSDIISILNINPDTEIVIANPQNIISPKIDNLVNESNKQSKILSDIKKTVDDLLRKIKFPR